MHGVNVDTSHFTGNYPSHCSIEAIDLSAGPKASRTAGVRIIFHACAVKASMLVCSAVSFSAR
ncbi:MAG: hypothetical protein ABIZ80_19305 [Bryobacteraceae bacterium]